MSEVVLDVYREHAEGYELLGHLERIQGLEPGSVTFRYDEAYLSSVGARPFSQSLPLQYGSFNEEKVRPFFDALLPEGDARKHLDLSLKASEDQFVKALASLNDETMGALIFEVPGVSPGTFERYEPVEDTFFDDFSVIPMAMALKVNRGMRLSLAGTMAKVGLYYDDATHEWCYPLGCAPSSHVVKAQGGSFSGQVFNEALCMRAARSVGLQAAETNLLRCPSTECVLLVSERFDRRRSSVRTLDGRARPDRLHQEDFCQALGMRSVEKYDEDGDEGAYLGCMSRVLAHVAESAFQERSNLFAYVVFNTLIGNCDAHLKNYALLYDDGWDYAVLAPLYDVVATTSWPALSTTLGLSFAGKRELGEITTSDFEHLASLLGMRRQAPQLCECARHMAELLPGAIESVRDDLIREGFPEVRKAADTILVDVRRRVADVFGCGKG